MTFIIAALLLGQSTLADIVFFDFNNGPLEIAAAQRAAQKRGERLIVYPVIPAATRVRLRALNDQMRAVETQLHSTADTNQRRQLELRYRELDVERSNLGDSRFGREEAKAAIRDMQARGVKVTSLILSGHDGNGDFSGTQGGLHSRDLSEILKEHPQFAANIKSLFLAGCYTAKPGMLEYTWKDAIPNLQSVAGYPGSAPAVDKLAGHQFLERFLSGEARLLNAKTPAEVRAIAGGMIPPDVHSTAAICLPNKKYFHRGQYRDLEDEWRSCPQTLETLARTKDTYLCYMEARPGCEDPPADSQSGPLREYYRALQAVQPCRHNPQFAAQTGELFDGEAMIRLIYHKNVRKNFSAQYRSQLEETKRMFMATGMSEELAGKLTKIANMNRKEILDMLREFEEFHADARGDEKELPSDNDKAAALIGMRSAIETLKGQLSYMNPRCVPFHWVEANSTARSECPLQDSLGNRAWELARQNVPIHRLDDRMRRMSREFNYRLSDAQREQRYYPAGPAPDPQPNPSEPYPAGFPGSAAEPPPGEEQAVPYQMPPDPIVSDAAVMNTITADETRQFEVRINALRRERDLLAAEQFISRHGNDPQHARDVQAYRQNIERYREQARKAAEEARALAPPLDLQALRENRREFFAHALRVLPDLTPNRVQMDEYRQNIDFLRRSVSEATNPQVRQRLEDDLASRERGLQELVQANERMQQHREYVERMSRVLSDTHTPADQERIAQLVLQRVRDGRQEQISHLTASIAYINQYTTACSNRPANDHCHRELQLHRGITAGYVQALARLQREVDLTDPR